MTMTREDVEARMVDAARPDPRVRHPRDLRPRTWPDRHVPDPDARKALKLWVWCEANGYTFFSVCRRRGVSYTTALRHKNRAVDRIVMLLNVEAALARTDSLFAAED